MRTAKALVYLTVWPTGQMPAYGLHLERRPGTIIANAAIVAAGTGGEIAAYPTDDTDLIIDINGYFAPAGPGGLSLYGVRLAGSSTRARRQRSALHRNPESAGGCGEQRMRSLQRGAGLRLQRDGRAVASLGYLTLWPDGTDQPWSRR